jgi:hypothetical protein
MKKEMFLMQMSLICFLICSKISLQCSLVGSTAKKHLTVLIGADMDGSEKLPACWKSMKPHFFNKYKPCHMNAQVTGQLG